MYILHVSVLPEETLRWGKPASGEVWVDATTGLGGHTRLLRDAVGTTGQILAIDQDAGMLQQAKSTLGTERVRYFHANFDQLEAVLQQAGVTAVDGVLADLGFCSAQMDDPERGLSFQKDGPLDMRLDREGSTSAADIVNTWEEEALADMFWEYGEERHSRRVARRIVERRQERPFERTGDLADVIRRAVPRTPGLRIDGATRCFQALRIAVNDELAALDALLSALPHILKPGGRAAIISFHSLEDRRVKQAFQASDIWDVQTRKPVEASEAEASQNPRSRSAKLRVAVRK